MNDDLIADLKQFISATIYQQTSDLQQDISGIKQDINGIKEDIGGIKVDLHNLDTKLTKKIDDLSDSVAEAIFQSNDQTDTTLTNHASRLTKLEASVV